MQAQQTPIKKRSTRAGVTRLLVHIVAFFAVGILLLGLGLFGRAQLQQRADGLTRDARVDTLLERGIALTRELAQGQEEDSDFKRLVNNALSSRKRLLKESVIKGVQEGQNDQDIARMVLSDLGDAILTRAADHPLYAELKQRLVMGEEGFVSALKAETEQVEEDLSPGQVRVRLPVTERYYPLMYYYLALLFLGGFCLLFALVLLYQYLRYDARKRARVGELLEPMDYLLPFFLGVLLFTLYPMVRVVIMSFQERYKLEGSFSGYGLGNYEYVLKGIPGTTNYFLQGLTNTLLYVLYTVPISTALAILIAYLLNQKLRFSALFQTSYFLPMVTSITAVGLVWRWIFNRNFGILNAILVLFGMSPADWLQKAGNSMTVLVVFGIWTSLPFTIILLLSGLQNIDETYYTVARVDGARATRIFRRITVPLLAPTIGLVLTINSISAFKVFTEVKVLFNGYPGPVKNLYTVVYYIYDMMYENRELGRAAAAAIVLFLFILVFTLLQRYIQRKWKYD